MTELYLQYAHHLIYGIRFYFYSLEGVEPMHFHVVKAEANGKIWIEPRIEVAYFHNFTKSEIKDIMEAIDTTISLIKTKWNEHFST